MALYDALVSWRAPEGGFGPKVLEATMRMVLPEGDPCTLDTGVVGGAATHIVEDEWGGGSVFRVELLRRLDLPSLATYEL